MKKLYFLPMFVFLVCGLMTVNSAAQTLINELDINPAGTDNPCEYIELKGTPGAEITGINFVSIEGDIGSTPGVATAVVTFGSPGPVFGSNGIFIITGTQTCGARVIPPGAGVAQVALLDGAGGALQNGTNSFLLIASPTAITAGTDYDTDNNGTLESLPAGATIIDGVAWSDGGVGDITYGSAILSATGGTVGACTRFPGNTTANSASAWYAGAMTGTNDSNTYSATIRSTNFPSTGVLTPGAPNVGTPDANVDMNGDGKTDWVVVRGTGSALGEMVKSGAYPAKGFGSVRERMKFQAANLNLLSAPSSLPMYWYTLINTTNEVQISQWGDALTDTLVPEDYDGDGKDDIAIWRPSADGAAFYIFQSATSTLRIEPFGHIGHDPTVVGDYDGDGKADPAVYECPPVGSPAGPCYFWYRSSLNPVGYNAVQWGYGNVGDNAPDPGDFDGDGKYDYCVQRQLPGGSPGQAQFALYNSGGTVELLSWGLTSDTVVPGDFDGDGKTDIMVVRSANNALTWYGYMRTTGGVTVANWGNPSTDTIAPGDYDGDGKTDYAIYRAATAPNPNTFWAYNSSNGAVQGVNWGSCQSGLPCDIPAANWYVH